MEKERIEISQAKSKKEIERTNFLWLRILTDLNELKRRNLDMIVSNIEMEMNRLNNK